MEFAVFLFGLVIGSFLNVVIYRMGSGRSIGGRSACLSCGKELRWYELIPLLSFLYQRGRCRECRSPLSIQYPLVEGGTGLTFLLLYREGLPLFETLFLFIIAAILIVIFVYDIRHTIIPDGLVFCFGGLSFLALFFEWATVSTRIPSAMELFSGPLIALPLFLLWLFSGGRWMGLGDAKLALGIGWLLGFSGGVAALVLSFWIGALVSVAILLFSRSPRLFGKGRQLTMKSEVPFGPFLIVGLFLALILDLHGVPIIF